MGRLREPSRTGGSISSQNICLAIFIGVICGIVLALLQWSSAKAPSLRGEDGVTEVLQIKRTFGTELEGGSSRQYQQLEEKLKKVEAERTALKAQQKELVEKADRLLAELKSAKKAKEAAEAQREALVLRTGKVKVGPPGQVKASSFFPTLEPDRAANPELAALLEKVAIDSEVLVALSNDRIHGMLQTWFENLQRAGVQNYLVVALDDSTEAFCRKHSVPVYRRHVEVSAAQKTVGSNHAVSGLKFHVLREFLVMGYSVFLSDVDIVFLQNPFKFLARDCDVEGMSDGFDDQKAYGFDDVDDDPSMGWSRYAHTMRIWVFNSGLFFLRPTAASVELIDRVAARLAKEKAWDQAVYNEELFRPSSPGYLGLHASKRVLDYHLFMNSKFLFTRLRKDPLKMLSTQPVSVHVNYHPDKHARMLAIVEYYVNGKRDALDRFPDGSGR